LKTEILGWHSSLILLVTIAKQIHKQWQERTSAGVSKWLFIGQLAASTGFALYSYLIHSWVFVATNSLMAVAALIGLTIHFNSRAAHGTQGR
jgi:MtN3 and saliva related transmembrane protein